MDWSEAWKYILLIAPPILGFFGRSWRNHWAGPKGLAARVRRRYHLEDQLFTTGQERDYWKETAQYEHGMAEYYKAKCYELMNEAKEVAILVSSIASSKDSSAPPPTPLQMVPARQSKKMPISMRSLRKRKGIAPTSSERLANDDSSTGMDDPIIPGRK